MKSVFDSQSLFVQMVSAFIAIVFLASIAVGVPAIWLLQDQLDHQAWSQVDRGQRVTRSLYESQYNELYNLATLTAQRPTLINFLIQKNIEGLTTYLTTLEQGAALDLIVICNPQNRLTASTIELLDDSICSSGENGHYHYDPTSDSVYMIATHPVITESNTIGEVIVCKNLDEDFSTQLYDQTGLEHLLWRNDTIITSSLKDQTDNIQQLPKTNEIQTDSYSKRELKTNEGTYYSGYFSLNSEDLFIEISLDVTELISTRSRLVKIAALSILVVSLVGSLLGTLLVHRINQPLLQLSNATAGFSIGEMDTPIHVKTRLKEISQLAITIENARLDLLSTLTSLEEERDWSEHLLDSIVEGIITINYDSQITFFSRGAEHILGKHAGQAIGCKINDIFQLPNHQGGFDTILPAILKERKNVDVLLPDHQIASLAITGARLSRPGEQETETVLVFRDISREEAVHRLLGQFLANTAHEFRTPLSSLEASIELLLDQAPELSKSELLELHTSLHIGLIGLHTLVDNLLESANIEARRFRISPRQCDLRDVIAEALQTMQPLLSKYQQNLTVELPIDDLLIKADPRRITQVLINLISNASRYGPSNSEIEIRTQINNDWVKIEVMDRGPGITPEYRKNLFSRFVYPQTSDHISTTGAGLGLSVVEAIVTAHGGEVGVEDRSGKGSIFWFRLPVE